MDQERQGQRAMLRKWRASHLPGKRAAFFMVWISLRYRLLTSLKTLICGFDSSGMAGSRGWVGLLRCVAGADFLYDAAFSCKKFLASLVSSPEVFGFPCLALYSSSSFFTSFRSIAVIIHLWGAGGRFFLGKQRGLADSERRSLGSAVAGGGKTRSRSRGVSRMSQEMARMSNSLLPHLSAGILRRSPS